jgi:sterol desaturase/sphingolipid hydroxylase (fatty acid hydroxylase superfamily)
MRVLKIRKMKSKKNCIRLFNNPVLEEMFKSRPLLQFVLWIGASVFFLLKAFANPQLSSGLIFMIGMMVMLGWPAFEYATHRWLYHLPIRGEAAGRTRYILHGHHHDDPTDLTRLLAPFVPTLIFSLVSFFVERAILGPDLIDPFFGFVCVAYTVHEFVHFSLHGYNFENKIFRRYKKFHFTHHLANSETNFGVTTVVWDQLARTVYSSSAPKAYPAQPISSLKLKERQTV